MTEHIERPDGDFSQQPSQQPGLGKVLPDGEPPLHPDDTQPRAPVEVRLRADEPPFDPGADTAPRAAWTPAPGRALLLALVMAGSVCLCLLMIGLAGVAGYRDGLATNDARVTQTLATGVAEQYQMGVDDLENGFPGLAEARFAWIVETLRAPTQYARDSAQRLVTARAVNAYTPTPQPTATRTPAPTDSVTRTPEQPTPALALSPESTALPTLSPLEDPAYLYNQAETAMMFTDYEDAIQLLESLRALDPGYRQAETTAMLQEALINQARIYLTGQNKDGQDRLQRGVLLMTQAQELGSISANQQWLVGQANFVQSYILARDYVNGGFYAEALPILQDLCAQNCDWSYPNVNGVSVRDLLNRAQQGTGSS